MLLSLIFLIPIFFFGVGTILAVQDALGFSNSVREFLTFVLLGLALLADDRFGPRAAQRESEEGR